MSSACLRRRSTRWPYCDAAGSGAVGGGPGRVIDAGFAATAEEAWRCRRVNVVTRCKGRAVN